MHPYETSVTSTGNLGHQQTVSDDIMKRKINTVTLKIQFGTVNKK